MYYPDAIEIDCHGKVGRCLLADATIQFPVRDNGKQWSHEPVSKYVLKNAIFQTTLLSFKYRSAGGESKMHLLSSNRMRLMPSRYQKSFF